MIYDRTLKHVYNKLKEKTQLNFSYSGFLNYKLPAKRGTKAAASHHDPAPIKVKSVGRTEMKNNIDGHYCACISRPTERGGFHAWGQVHNDFTR